MRCCNTHLKKCDGLIRGKCAKKEEVRVPYDDVDADEMLVREEEER
jgi:hypothetical protein